MKKIFSILKKIFWDESGIIMWIRIVVFCFLTAVFQFLFLRAGRYSTRAENYNFFRVLFMTLMLLEFRHLIRWKDAAKKLKNFQTSFRERLMRLFGGGLEFLAGLLDRKRRARGQKAYILGYRDERIKIQGTGEQKKKRRKWKKYRQMDADEKIRYQYWSFLMRAKKRGYQVKESDTPVEVIHSMGTSKEKDYGGALVGIYNKVRYKNGYRATEADVELAERKDL